MTAHLAPDAPLAELRQALIESGYQQHAHQARTLRSAFSRPDAVPAVVRGQSRGGAQGVLLDLFAYGAEVDEQKAERVLSPVTLQALKRAGILQHRAGRWRSRLTIGGHEDVFVFGDLSRRGVRRDHVDGYTVVAQLARRLAVPVGSGRLLDLGTGSGIHSLLAAREGGRAVGADINPHALQLAALGERLSDVAGVQWCQGSWYEPADGEQFDRIICVAPYVVSPDTEFTFRDGDRSEQDPVRTVAAGARAHLAPGGCALVMCCWGHGAHEDWSRAPMRWLAPRGADVILLRLSEVDPVRYALDWNRPPMRTLAPPEHDRVMGRWLTHYAREGFECISFGALLVRRRRGTARGGTGRATLDGTSAGEHSGEQLGRALANLELLATVGKDDPGLLSLALEVPEGQRVEQRLQRDDRRYRLRRAAIRQRDGLDVSVDVTSQVLEVVYRLDGRRTLAQALADVGAGRGAAGRARTAETLEATRELLRAGLLVSPAAS